jgi:spermidine synthase
MSAAGMAATVPAAEAPRARWVLPALAALFFVSGACGLVYQVLWLRLLGLVFGVTTWAAAAVLSSFMGGLALGSALAGRVADRVRRPLLGYAAAEVLVGLSALATLPALRAVEWIYVAASPALPGQGALTLLRFVLSFATLAVPTTLMGATLPLVIRSSLLRSEDLGGRVGLLYGANTAGAIAGTLLAGFVLVGGIGIGATCRLAAALNVLAGLAAAAMSRALARGAPADEGARAAAPSGDGAAIGEGRRRVVLLVFAVSGFVALALEIVWFRVLVLFVQVTTYAFTIMLATVLAGIALGSHAVAPALRRRADWPFALAVLELGVGLASVLSFAGLARSYAARAALDPLLGPRSEGDIALTAIASLLAIFPACFLMGVAFPVGLHVYAGGAPDTGRRVGLFYSLNVCGGIAGSAAAGFLLLPRLGSPGSLLLLSGLGLATGLLLLAALPRRRPALAAAVGLASLAAFAAAARAMPNPFAVEVAERHRGEKLLWIEEGIQTTVSVHQRWDGARKLYLDGLHQADDRPGMIRLHRTIGHLVMALHPAPREALVVGLGGGATPGAVSRHAGAQVDVVELSDTVVRSAEWFRHVNDDVLRRRNVHLRIDDGRNWLLRTPKRYDVITADVIHPFHAGSGNLYSLEYFRLARRALGEAGLMLQWVGPFPESQYRLVLSAFAAAFPETTLWEEGSLAVGSMRPLRLDRAAFERKLEDPGTRAALEEVGLGSFEALLGRYWGGPEEIRRYLGASPPLTDDRPQVEYFLSLPHGEPLPDVSRLKGDAAHVLPAEWGA